MKLRVRTGLYNQRKYLTYFYWSYALLIRRVTAALMKLAGMMEYVEIINAALWIVATVVFIKVFICSVEWQDILFGVGVALFMQLSVYIWPSNTFINERKTGFLLCVFPFFYVGKSLLVDSRIMRDLGGISSLVIAINYMVYFFYYKRGGGRGIFDDNMAFAYDLLPHVILLLYFALRKQTLRAWALAILSIALLIMQGTRGPIVFLIVFMVWYSWVTQPFMTYTLKLTFVVFTGGIIFITGVFEEIILALIETGTTLGVSTRVLETILETCQSGIKPNFWRQYLFNIAKEGIKKNPYLGYGPYGDYFLTKNDPHFLGGIYIHNIIVELICDYGIVVGVLLFGILCCILLRAYIRSGSIERRLFIILLASSSIMKFFFSGSYLQEPVFYVLLGYCFSMIGQKVKRVSYSTFTKPRWHY